jgi:hypothetical protein
LFNEKTTLQGPATSFFGVKARFLLHWLALRGAG